MKFIILQQLIYDLIWHWRESSHLQNLQFESLPQSKTYHIIVSSFKCEKFITFDIVALLSISPWDWFRKRNQSKCVPLNSVITNFGNFILTTLSFFGAIVSLLSSMRRLCVWSLIYYLLCSSSNWHSFLISSCWNRCSFLCSCSLNCCCFSSSCLRHSFSFSFSFSGVCIFTFHFH